MSLLDLDLVKQHLRVDDSDSDALIAAYQAAAEAIVVEYVDRDVYAAGDSPGPTDDYSMQIEPPMVAAILLLIGDLYAQRETEDADAARKPTLAQNAVLPRAVRALLAPYRVWRTVSEGVC
jgi:hypothetical protein